MLQATSEHEEEEQEEEDEGAGGEVKADDSEDSSLLEIRQRMAASKLSEARKAADTRASQAVETTAVVPPHLSVSPRCLVRFMYHQVSARSDF